jgi:hypothetical protein
MLIKGRFPFHKKAIFAFRQDGQGAEIVLMGMYVHEFVVANSINMLLTKPLCY